MLSSTQFNKFKKIHNLLINITQEKY